MAVNILIGSSQKILVKQPGDHILKHLEVWLASGNNVIDKYSNTAKEGYGLIDDVTYNGVDDKTEITLNLEYTKTKNYPDGNINIELLTSTSAVGFDEDYRRLGLLSNAITMLDSISMGY